MHLRGTFIHIRRVLGSSPPLVLNLCYVNYHWWKGRMQQWNSNAERRRDRRKRYISSVHLIVWVCLVRLNQHISISRSHLVARPVLLEKMLIVLDLLHPPPEERAISHYENGHVTNWCSRRQEHPQGMVMPRLAHHSLFLFVLLLLCPLDGDLHCLRKSLSMFVITVVLPRARHDNLRGGPMCKD